MKYSPPKKNPTPEAPCQRWVGVGGWLARPPGLQPPHRGPPSSPPPPRGAAPPPPAPPAAPAAAPRRWRPPAGQHPAAGSIRQVGGGLVVPRGQASPPHVCPPWPTPERHPRFGDHSVGGCGKRDVWPCYPHPTFIPNPNPSQPLTGFQWTSSEESWMKPIQVHLRTRGHPPP